MVSASLSPAGQHDDRRRHPVLAHQPAGLAAVHVGQVDVEQDQVGADSRGPCRTPSAAVAGLDGAELLVQLRAARPARRAGRRRRRRSGSSSVAPWGGTCTAPAVRAKRSLEDAQRDFTAYADGRFDLGGRKVRCALGKGGVIAGRRQARGRRRYAARRLADAPRALPPRPGPDARHRACPSRAIGRRTTAGATRPPTRTTTAGEAPLPGQRRDACGATTSSTTWW